MQLLVKSATGPTLLLNVESASNLGDLRGVLEARTGVPRCQQRLLAQGRQLGSSDDGQSLRALGLGSESTVRLLLRLPGGGPEGREMFLSVKVMGGRAVRVALPRSQDTTVGDLQTKLRTSEGLEVSSYELMYAGQRLESARTLSSYQIGPDASLDVVILPATGTPSAAVSIPMAPKSRCAVAECSGRIAKIVGECRYCGHGYCSRHRLPESHQCDNMQGCRQQSYEKNSSKLLGEKCVADKV